jgi:uncharacterized protein (DUF2141 family)
MITAGRLAMAIVAALLFILALPALVLAADGGNIVVHVNGLRNNNGVVRIALFNSATDYSADKNTAEKSFQKLTAPINNKEATANLANIPYGEYAIKLFHDEDNSGHFVTDAFGIPKVEYGFSNNAHGVFGPASYNKAKFKLESKKLDITIKMQN